MPKSSNSNSSSSNVGANSSVIRSFFLKIQFLFNKWCIDSIFLKKLNFLQSKSNSNAHANAAITNRINRFADKIVEEIMIPRADIISVNINANLDILSKEIVQHGHTRTLIYKERLDNIVGFVHIKDLFEVVSCDKKFNLKKLIRKHIIAPHSMKLTDLLTQMHAHRTHIAVIVDEYGSTDGIVTIEDIIKEVVGKIDDEHDIYEARDLYKIVKPGVMIASARIEIEEIERLLKVKLKTDSDEFDTMAGLIISKSGKLLQVNEVITINDNITIKVLESTPRIIKQIQITYPDSVS